MKVFWWQGGLHFEPENKAETDALMILWEAKRESPVESLTGLSVGFTSTSGCIGPKPIQSVARKGGTHARRL